MQIYVKQLKRKFNVPTSHKNMRRVLVMQKFFEKGQGNTFF